MEFKEVDGYVDMTVGAGLQWDTTMSFYNYTQLYPVGWFLFKVGE